ncbi:hypothetical protein NUW58_g5923 [Xylaria curta]|uniref:Uncharacterized protein n=1 Tax=Xylaria curta TaxID=42375 RepID=A0ACC1NZA9_9PEZI|nr:hypothetical protein NUW58_g5923 [Xylaria curta]
MPATNEDGARIMAAAEASKNKRSKNQAERERRERKEAENSVEAPTTPEKRPEKDKRTTNLRHGTLSQSSGDWLSKGVGNADFMLNTL